jgi:deoxyribonuclease-4
MLFGVHSSISGGIWTALERTAACGGEICQLFVKNNMQWRGRPPPPADLELFARRWKEYAFRWVFGHAGYLINIAAPPSPNRDKSIQSLLQEIEFATALNLPFLVLHPGAHLSAGEAEGLKHAVAALDEVFSATRHSKLRIALENTAGQGSCLGDVPEHIAAIYDRVKNPERLAICLDTAHLFASGSDVRTQKGWQTAIEGYAKLVGIRQIVAFHLNDSKTDLGSRVDRHAHIGQGKIGKAGFRHIINDPRFHRHPGCLETPKSKDLAEDVMNLAALRALSRYSRKY